MGFGEGGELPLELLARVALLIGLLTSSLRADAQLDEWRRAR